jgi:predicted aldo/keto reductase-like oxidoreductase
MNYRKNMVNGDMLSILGFGCMRFPKKGNAIDEDKAEKLIVSAIESGVNYFDTAYVYHGGKSEVFLGKVLKKGYRDRVKIATKLPYFMVGKLQDAEKIFNTQLARLQTDHIDYYLLHMLTDVDALERLKSIGIFEWLESKKKSGQIINFGFSFHGNKGGFVRLIDAYDWDFCQIQYNFLDENNQAGTSGLKYASEKGIPVFVMEPLRGGKIVNSLPKEVDEIWDAAKPKRSAADWALRWVWNHPEAVLLLSGMGDDKQVEENIRVASDAEANSLSIEELELFDRVKNILFAKIKVNCTACGYCMPCPHGVDIPGCFSYYNESFMRSGFLAKLGYMQNTGAISKHPGYASLCKKCKKCEEHCPQSIQISQKLTEVTHEMEGPIFKPMVSLAKFLMKVK